MKVKVTKITVKKLLREIWKKSQNHVQLQAFLGYVYSLVNRNTQKTIGDGNTIQMRGAFLKQVHILISGNNNKVIIKSGSRITYTRIVIIGSNHLLEIDENCIYKSGQLWLEDGACQIVIGKNTTVEGALLKSVEPGSSITIGSDCMLGDHIEVRTSDLHSIIDVSSGKRINPAESVVIGNHVWLGAHVRVLKGVSIGDHSIVGTDSVVTKSVPQYCIAAGSPARVIKENITWLRERVLDYNSSSAEH